jgi:hypothetical protein
MQIAGIKLSYLHQTFPIPDMKLAPLKIHHPGRSKLLQGTVHGGYGHSKGFSSLNKTYRRCKLIPLRQAGGTGPIV